MSTHPPFKLATATVSALQANQLRYGSACCEGEPSSRLGRLKLADLDTHFQCSVIGTCMSTGALRKVMSRFIDVHGASDLEIHHEAVLLASEPGAASRALHKALDHQHEATLARLARVPSAEQLLASWEEALRSGDIPGAYWAVLTHRQTTDGLRKKVFGDVHMLSHLVGAANRADIRRLVALEADNVALREQVDQHRERRLSHEHKIQALQSDLSDAQQALATEQRMKAEAGPAQDHPEKVRLANEQVALQTQRREAAEQLAASAQAGLVQVGEELEHLHKYAMAVSAELTAAEAQLRQLADGSNPASASFAAHAWLAGRRILYVGGRPSSTPSIRALVERHGGDFRHHDGGLEDRKGLLAAGVAWAELVVFPVDCVDHDSVASLKRLCARDGIDFWPLRSAGIGSFAAALAGAASASAQAPRTGSYPCPKHG